jgi:hypothetical protein
MKTKKNLYSVFQLVRVYPRDLRSEEIEICKLKKQGKKEKSILLIWISSVHM